MYKLELLPTEENIIKTLKEDLIGRNEDLSHFINIINSIQCSYSISIDGQWGSGKTFFVKQAEFLINSFNNNYVQNDKINSELSNLPNLAIEEKNQSCMAVYYDAWKNDNDCDPAYSLIYEICMQLHEKYNITDFDIKNLGATIIETFTKVNTKDYVDLLKSEDSVSKFTSDKEFEEKNREFFTKLLEERANKLIIFIDELDRCKPTFAVQLLERIKHYFYDDRIIFVFSTNSIQLQHTIKRYYGNEFDASRYLNRFFDLNIILTNPDLTKYYSKLGLSRMYTVDHVLKIIINQYNFQMREIDKFVHQVKCAVDIKHEYYDDFDFDDGKGREIIMIVIVPLIIGLELYDKNLYYNFINGNDSKPLIDLFLDIDNLNYLNDLLSNNESFAKVENKVPVTKEDLIKKLYHAIFQKKYTSSDYETILGKCAFKSLSSKLCKF